MDNAGGCLVTRKTEHDYGITTGLCHFFFPLIFEVVNIGPF